MRLQLNAPEPALDVARGDPTKGAYPTAVSGSISRISSSRVRMRIEAPQSRHRDSTKISCPGNSQRTASDSSPHWPYHFCTPPTLIRYCVGTLLKGAQDSM